LGYKHLRTRISGSKAIAFLENIDKRAIILETLLEVDLSPDPDDNPILATAITGKVELVVSGDKGHMIALGNANGIPIVTAREALARLRVDA
jgi:predicted nucleic acid-binding protein